MVTPYTPSELIASVNRKPTGRSATTMSTRPTPGTGSGEANGITAHVIMAGTKAMAGARMKSALFTPPGIDSSFMKFFTPSAMGWRKPSQPTRFGPRRSWIQPATRRSASVVYATQSI